MSQPTRPSNAALRANSLLSQPAVLANETGRAENVVPIAVRSSEQASLAYCGLVPLQNVQGNLSKYILHASVFMVFAASLAGYALAGATPTLAVLTLVPVSFVLWLSGLFLIPSDRPAPDRLGLGVATTVFWGLCGLTVAAVAFA